MSQIHISVITIIVSLFLSFIEEVHYERKKTGMIPLSDTFFNPELIYTPGELDKFLVGLATQPRQKFDNIFSEEVTNHLFQGKNKSFGLDLVALNVQRGRDHGLPGYNAFRELCGLGRVTDFDFLADTIPHKIVERLKMIYRDVDDIDLFIGGIVETSVPGNYSPQSTSTNGNPMFRRDSGTNLSVPDRRPVQETAAGGQILL